MKRMRRERNIFALAGYPFPPARGRDALSLDADGTLRRTVPARTIVLLKCRPVPGELDGQQLILHRRRRCEEGVLDRRRSRSAAPATSQNVFVISPHDRSRRRKETTMAKAKKNNGTTPPPATSAPPTDATPQVRNCGTMPVHERLLRTIPEYRNARNTNENHAFQFARGMRAGAHTSITVIPVVVHVVFHTAAQNISDAQINSQITILNQDYRKTNADIELYPCRLPTTVWRCPHRDFSSHPPTPIATPPPGSLAPKRTKPASPTPTTSLSGLGWS